MSEIIDVSVSAKIKNGPTLSTFDSIEVDAYDKVTIAITAGNTQTVQVVPSGTPAVLFLLIKSNNYGQLLTYTVNGGADTIVLDKPQAFIGQGALAALDIANPPSTLEFSNLLAVDVEIQLLVGRNALS